MSWRDSLWDGIYLKRKTRSTFKEKSIWTISFKTRTNIPDVIEPQVHGDIFRANKLEEFLGYKINFCQDNESKGLHYQLAPDAQTKLVRVMQGSVLEKEVQLLENMYLLS